MLKSIPFRDVRVGDVVCVQEGVKLKVVDIGEGSNDAPADVQLHMEGGGVRCGYPDELIGLCYRPYPEGKTAQQMRDEIWRHAQRLASLMDGGGHIEVHLSGVDVIIGQLREAMDAYELGKSEKERTDEMISEWLR